MDGLVDVDDHALLQPGRRHDALADDREAAVAADLADEGHDLGRPDVDPDQTASRSTRSVLGLPSGSASAKFDRSSRVRKGEFALI